MLQRSTQFFRKLLKKEAPTSVDASFAKRCVENLDGARAELTADQSALAQDIEKTFEALDERLYQLATRLRELPKEEVERESRSIREAHDSLRRVVRRFQAAMKGSEELEHELQGWQEHPGEAGMHADHPLVRAEIARSELAVRDVEQMKKAKAAPATSIKIPVETTQGRMEVKVHEVDARMIPDEKSLLAAIYEATREAERWHGLTPEKFSQDAVDQVRLVRDLNGILKRLDKANGIKRDRMGMGIQMREWH